MVQCPREAISHSASEETPHISWDMKAHYHVLKSLLSLRLWFMYRAGFIWWGVISPQHGPQDGGPLFVSSPWLLILYICSYPPYL